MDTVSKIVGEIKTSVAVITTANSNVLRFVLLLMVVLWCAMLGIKREAQAEITESNGAIQFIGNFRAPGQEDQPRTVPINKDAFADEARADPPCTGPGDCSTQLQSSGAPISVEDALTGYSRTTSYLYAGGDLVLTFTDFLPVNDTGPDLAVFEGYSQRGFAIKVRTNHGEYGFVDVPAEPFIQISNGNWGPCFPGRVLDGCTFFGLLLVYEIDLDDLGVPAGDVVEEVTIRKKQVHDPFGDVPSLVMIAAENGAYAGPGPRPKPENIAGMIRNGFFDDGFNEWTVNGPGSVSVTQTITGPAVEIATDSEPTSLSQDIDTPNTSFVISFDYRFATNNGSVDVLLNGTQIDTLAAEMSPIYRHRDVLVNDPNLMGVSAAELSFRVNPGSLDDFLLGNIVSPNYELLASAVSIYGKARVTSGPDSFENIIDKNCDKETPECQALGGGLFVSDDTPFLDVPGSQSTASAFARSFAFLEGVGIGVRGFAQSDGALVGQESGSFVDIKSPPHSIIDNPDTTYAVVRYQAISAENPQGRYPINYRLNIAGQVDFVGNLESGDPRLNQVTYDVNGTIAIYRARLGLSETVPFAFAGELFFQPDTAGSDKDEVEERDDFKDGSNCTYDPNDSGPPPPPVGTPAIGDPIDGPGNSRTYLVNFSYCSPEILYAREGDQVEVRLSVGLHVAATPSFGGYVNADFSRTATASISTDVPGIQFVPVDFSSGETNQPPTANAGTDQTVAVGPACSASVSLDGSGSSDPDGDALTYNWTGPFGTASGVGPVVTLTPGMYTIQLTVDDGKGGTSTDDVLITVADETPPAISAMASPNILWPPNHKMVPIGTSINATDNCGMTNVSLTSVTMNEDDEASAFDPGYDSTVGDGNTAGDIQVDSTGNVSLRAERSGTGSGRVYTIEYVATDNAGNSTSVSTMVTVPHDQ